MLHCLLKLNCTEVGKEYLGKNKTRSKGERLRCVQGTEGRSASLKAVQVIGEGLGLSWSNEKSFNSSERVGRVRCSMTISMRRGGIQELFWL